MSLPPRLDRIRNERALVDGIPFTLPVASTEASALVAAFPIDPTRARAAIPGGEVHPAILWSRALLVVTVVDYRKTSIGNYVEYSVAIACTHGPRAAPRLLPAIFQSYYGTGQYVLDLPVSTEISVKGGKGIWGMPKHRAQLDFKIGERSVSSQYDKDGQLVAYVEIDRPDAWLPIDLGAANYCAFRGMLMKSYIYFHGKCGFRLGGGARAKLVLGDHPRAQLIRSLEVSEKPLFTAFIPEVTGVLDDYFECWFLGGETPPGQPMEGMSNVDQLGLGKDWLLPPSAPVPGVHE